MSNELCKLVTHFFLNFRQQIIISFKENIKQGSFEPYDVLPYLSFINASI